MTAALPTARALDRVHVLVVDDDEDAIAIAAAVLAQAGAIVETARSADAAIACADRAMPDLVVADLMMPGRSGEELLVALRDRDEELPVIAVSAAADWSNQDALRRLGFDAVVAKPIDFAAFVRIAVEVVGASEPSDEIAPAPDGFPPPRRSGTVPRSRRLVRAKRRLRTA